ncbi:MAG: hypothetical protein HKN80_14945 [Acidimicrobiia bacterium]|nr:hypothetical protein [Acidimicrobiia bacterium]
MRPSSELMRVTYGHAACDTRPWPSRNFEGGPMLRVWIRCQAWWQSDDGASLVEYALLLLLIAVVAVVVITQVGGTASSAIDKANTGFK